MCPRHRHSCRQVFASLLLLATFSGRPPLSGAGSTSADATTPFLRDALQGFDRWDADHDGTLVLREIDLAIASPEVTAGQAAAAVALRRVAGNRRKPVTSFTRESIRALATVARVDDSPAWQEDSGSARSATLETCYADALEKITSTPRDLFIDGQPRLAGCRQGRLGSCFSLAPLTALVNRDPQAVVRLFRAEEDGSITVLLGGGATPVTIAPLTDGELALTSSTGGNGVWIALYEKAVGQFRAAGKAGATPSTPLATVTRGGSAGTMISVLTGNAIRRFSCAPWREPLADSATQAARLGELRSLLRSGTADRRLMTAGTSATTRKVPGLARKHAYAVLGYDAATDLVTVRDPHGQTFEPAGETGLENGYAVREGIFRVPVPEIVQFMSGFAFQRETPATPAKHADPSVATDAGASGDE
ncbi:Calpain family cysteine protease [Opitutaceae bacterium TAV1]|nr:Calpain family cysteine protease [Opitutaceae bacterium TAV1]